MDLDWWTLGIQTVNVLILIWLLRRFFWRPLAAMIAQRQVEARALLDDAKVKRDEAASALAAIETTRAGFASEREAILAAAATTAKELKAAALKAAITEADALREAAKAEIARDAATAEKARAGQSITLAVDIAARLASRLEGPAVQAAFLGWLLSEIDAMPEHAKHVVAGKSEALDLISAVPLEPDDETRIAKDIARAFAAKPKVSFTTNPALIAGFELHGPHFTLRNSWQADLERIRRDLLHDA